MTDNDDRYFGIERRKGPRRNNPDRRTEIRFEPDKEDRRQNPGRRKTDRVGGRWAGAGIHVPHTEADESGEKDKDKS